MNWTIILLAALIVLWLFDLIRWMIGRRDMKKFNLRLDQRHAEQLEAWFKLEIAIKNAKLDVVERNSIKRHIRTLLDRMDEFDESLEQKLHPAMVLKDAGVGLDLDKIIEEMKTTGAIVLPEVDEKEKMIEEMRKLIEIQGRKGNWDLDEYMRGMYNGMELMLSVAEDRGPIYKNKGDEDNEHGA